MGSGLRIAIADDELDIREYLTYILTRMGFIVTAVAQNGRELLEACLANMPDLVITDIKMPEMDGLEASAKLYSHSPLLIILMSANNLEEAVRCADLPHITGFLGKPIRTDTLKKALHEALDRWKEKKR